MGKIKAISISEKKGMKKKNVSSAVFKEDSGIVGDAHAGSGHRQVSLLAEESIDKMREKGLDVVAGNFAENLTTEGMDLIGLPLGTRVKVGADVILEISQIGKECHTRCEIYQQAGDCIMPREGIFGRVVAGGTVKPGDEINIE